MSNQMVFSNFPFLIIFMYLNMHVSPIIACSFSCHNPSCWSPNILLITSMEIWNSTRITFIHFSAAVFTLHLESGCGQKYFTIFLIWCMCCFMYVQMTLSLVIHYILNFRVSCCIILLHYSVHQIHTNVILMLIRVLVHC